MIGAEKYTVMIQLVEDDKSGNFYCATVAELPDLKVYGESYPEAYETAISVIQTAQEMYAEEGRPFPPPKVRNNFDVSGRFSVRVRKPVHAALVKIAEDQSVSLNLLVSGVLERFVKHKEVEVKINDLVSDYVMAKLDHVSGVVGFVQGVTQKARRVKTRIIGGNPSLWPIGFDPDFAVSEHLDLVSDVVRFRGAGSAAIAQGYFTAEDTEKAAKH